MVNVEQVIADVGHHVDLMFSNPKDTDAIKRAREYEVGKIREWIRAAKEAGGVAVAVE